MTAAVPARSFMSIGEVLAKLRPDFPDVTISKIRFLESEGLVEPSRTSSGYRKFSFEDLERLRYVLTAQRDRYLPLRVIKDHLEAIDRGLEPPTVAGGGPRVPRAVSSGDGFPGPESFAPDPSDLRLSRAELIEAAGVDEALLAELESFGLVVARRPGQYYDTDALAVASAAAALAGFGIEPRHLRAVKASAEREVGLVEQVVTPLVRQRSPESRARADEVSREIAAVSVRLHAVLVRAALRPILAR
ncbi:MAG: transcriptional regulator FtsR [Actinomycetes bacterium]